MTTTTQFAAIQNDGSLRTPLVYGLGATADAAMQDAREWAEDLSVLAVYPCTAALVAQVEAGQPECAIVGGVADVR